MRIVKQGDKITGFGAAPDIRNAASLPGARAIEVSAGRFELQIPFIWESLKLLAYRYQGKLDVADSLRIEATLLHSARVEIDACRTNEKLIIEPGVLYPYQRAGVAWLMAQPKAILADDMGLGKTVQTLIALDNLDAWPVLIVSPASAMRVWESEFNKWLPGLRPVVVEGSKSRRQRLLAEPSDAYIISYSNVAAHSKLAYYGSKYAKKKDPNDQLLNRPWGALILDEAHRIKNARAQRTRACWAIAETSARKILLTGTPISNHPGDLWALLRCLDKVAWPSWSRYLDTFLETRPAFRGQGLEVIGIDPPIEPVFRDLVDHHLLRRTVEEYGEDLPDVVRQTYRVPLSKGQQDQYTTLLNDHVLDGQQITQTLTLAARLHQVAQAVTVWDHKEAKFKMSEVSSKIGVLKDLLEDFEDPVLVFTHSKQLAEQAGEVCSLPVITGSTPKLERQELIDDFQNNLLDGLVATVGTLAESVTLTAAKATIFLQRSFSLVENLQAEGRTRRVGSKHSTVFVIDIVTENTVDELPAFAVQDKYKHLQAILRDPHQITSWGRQIKVERPEDKYI